MKTSKMVLFVVKQYSVRNAKLAVRSTQAWNIAVRKGEGVHPYRDFNDYRAIDQCT